MHIFKKLKEEGIIADGDVLVTGSFKLTSGQIGWAIFKSILLLIVTLGMFYTIPQAKIFFMAIKKKELVLFIDGQTSILEKESVKAMVLKKEKKRSLTALVKLNDGQEFTLVMRSYKKQETTQEMKHALLENITENV